MSFSIQQGEIHGLIGPNGAGKTTLFNVTCGVYKPQKGGLWFRDKPLPVKPHLVSKIGIGRTFQLVKPFQQMTTLQNIAVAVAAGKRNVKRLKEATEKAAEILEFTELKGKEYMPAGKLNLADRKRLEIGRALGTEPELLLLDEVAAGLSPFEAEKAMYLINRIRGRGITIFVIEHVMKVIMNLSDRITVLNFGTKIAEGKPEQVANNPRVIEAYLGEKDDSFS